MHKTKEKPIHVWFRNATCDRIVDRKTTYLRPDPQYVIKHDRRHTGYFMAALLRHGKTHPALLMNKRKIIAGFGHMQGSKGLGGRHFPTIDVQFLNKHELQRWVTMMINLAAQEGWPQHFLAIEFQVLAKMDFGFDLNFKGFELTGEEQG